MTSHVQPIFPAADFYSELSGEADHRIANSLALISSLVRVRARDAGRVDPVVLLTEVADRIETVAKLHRLVAHSPDERVSLQEFLHEICTRLSGSVASKETSIALECPADRPVVSGVALPLGLIAAELVSNSLKYAHPAGTPVKISITCRNVPGGLHLTYEDDGVGFPEEFDATDKSNMGMRFIHLLCQKLQATPEWTSDALGMRLDIVVPDATGD